MAYPQQAVSQMEGLSAVLQNCHQAAVATPQVSNDSGAIPKPAACKVATSCHFLSFTAAGTFILVLVSGTLQKRTIWTLYHTVSSVLTFSLLLTLQQPVSNSSS